jgi:hypothetical protein
VIIFTDEQIAALIAERKNLPDGVVGKLLPDISKRQWTRSQDVTGIAGNAFRIIVRQVPTHPHNFSVILAHRLPNSNTLFNLRRYNAQEEHTNRLEGQKFFGYHIHTATKRYQEAGGKVEAYAERCERFHDTASALWCLIEDCGCVLSPEDEYLHRSLLRIVQ